MRAIVASCGRSGSTLIFGVVAAAFPEEAYSFVRHPLDFPDRGIIKTHCWAPAKLSDSTRYIYCYGNPVLCAISANSQPDSFKRLHFANMGGTYLLKDFWPREDVLHIEQNYRSWQRHFGKKNVFPLHYDDIYHPDTKPRLERFLGVSLKFPPKEDRETVIDTGILEHATAVKTYGKIFD